MITQLLSPVRENLLCGHLDFLSLLARKMTMARMTMKAHVEDDRLVLEWLVKSTISITLQPNKTNKKKKRMLHD